MQVLTRAIRRGLPATMALAIALLSACSKDETAPTAVPTTLAVASGNNQAVIAGKAVTDPLIVTLKDQNGNPISGATVTSTIANGGGALDVSTTATDVNGQAKAMYTAATTAGTATITARLGALTARSSRTSIRPSLSARRIRT